MSLKIVVIPVYDGPYMLLNRNLLYTAVTRAKTLRCWWGAKISYEKND
ncbi:MAG: ATP-binding domain-containing protein [Clostridiales bacterium]|nr:MAG: ATP-binding domain-containing protein [Clostridiales bacterium]